MNAPLAILQERGTSAGDECGTLESEGAVVACALCLVVADEGSTGIAAAHGIQVEYVVGIEVRDGGPVESIEIMRRIKRPNRHLSAPPDRVRTPRGTRSV